jgi:hypothetical protein
MDPMNREERKFSDEIIENLPGIFYQLGRCGRLLLAHLLAVVALSTSVMEREVPWGTASFMIQPVDLEPFIQGFAEPMHSRFSPVSLPGSRER